MFRNFLFGFVLLLLSIKVDAQPLEIFSPNSTICNTQNNIPFLNSASNLLFQQVSRSELYNTHKMYLLILVFITVMLITIIIFLISSIKKRNKIEKELNESEERLNLALNVVDDGIWDWNLTSGEIYFSKRWLEIIGYSEGAIKNNYETWQSLIHPDDSINFKDELHAHLRGESPYYKIEYRMLAADGEWKWIFDRGRVVMRDNQGNPLRMVGIHQDISERKKIETALQESECIFRNFIEQSTDGIYLVNSSGIIIQWNKGAENITGLNNSETIGKLFWEVQYNLLPNKEKSEKSLEYFKSIFKDYINNNDDDWTNHTFELKICRPEKNFSFIRQVIFPIRIKNGILLGSLIHDISKRKKIEAAVRENERKYHELAEMLPQAVFETDLNGRLTFINKVAFELFKYSQYDFDNGLYFFQFFNEDGVQKAKNDFSRILKGERLEHEYIAINKEGKKFPVVTHSSAIVNDGECSGIRGLIIDISERKKYEEIMLESEARYRTLIEHQSDGVGIVNFDENFVYSNTAADIIFGVHPGTLEGKNLAEFVNEDQFPFIREQTMKRVKGEKSAYELSIKRKDGEIRTLAITVAPYSTRHNIVTGAFGVFHDVTEKKNAEEKIRQLSRAVDQSPNSIVITDLNGNIVYVNPKFTTITGYSINEVIGNNPRILKSGEHSDDLYKKLWGSISAGEEWNGEFHNKKKNGELFWELASISSIKNEEGKITHFLAVKEDITERKIAEKELLIAKEEAEKSNRLKSEFLAQMSHEIRTPINTILSFAGLLKEELSDQLPDDLKTSFRIIDNGGRRLIRTVDLILDMSKIQTGNFELFISEIDLNEILENLMLDFIAFAKERKIGLKYNCETDNRIITGDYYTVSQIFSNLIDNALKYTATGCVDIKLYNGEEKIKVQIKDTGIGISEQYLPYLFTSFSQEETGYTRRFEGTGLGLALVKKYTELNNADIIVKSKKGEGSTFTVVFNSD